METYDSIRPPNAGLLLSAKTHFKVIKDLNPEIRGHYVAAGNHIVLIPKGGSKDFHDRFRRLVKKFVASRKERVYIVREGDNLSTIAERFDIPLPALLIWNRLDLKRPIHPGDRLIIHPRNMDSVDKSVPGKKTRMHRPAGEKDGS